MKNADKPMHHFSLTCKYIAGRRNYKIFFTMIIILIILIHKGISDEKC